MAIDASQHDLAARRPARTRSWASSF